MSAESLGESFGTLDGRLNTFQWDKPKKMRKVVFWIMLVLFV